MKVKDIKRLGMCDTTRSIYIIMRTPEQYNGIEIEDGSVEEDVMGVEAYQRECVAFDYMLDTSQNLLDPFFTRGRHNELDV